MKVLVDIKLIGSKYSKLLPARRIELKDNDIESVTVDFGSKTIPRFITYKKGSSEWNDVIRGLIFISSDEKEYIIERYKPRRD